MSRRFQVDPFDLLGQKEPYPLPVELRGTGEPRLSVAWKGFHQSFFSELVAFFQWTRRPKSDVDFNVFRDCRVRRSIPARAIFAAALWHVVFFIVPWPALPGAAKGNPAFDNTELTWSGPIEDLPLLNVPKPATRVARPRTEETKPLAEGTEAYHPRQRIFTDPVHPTHPRQTLVRPSAPLEAPKFLPSMPNLVQLAAPVAPSRPRLEISEQALAKLRPKEVKRGATKNAPSDAPNLEAHPADISLASITTAVERPKLEVDAGSAPRMAAQTRKGEIAAAPELAPTTTGAPAGPSETIIALSSAPAAPSPVVEVPKGNLAANVAISPEGKGAGVGEGSRNTANGAGGTSVANAGNATETSAVGISISGGNPKPNAGLSGLGGAGKLSLPKGQPGYRRPDPNSNLDDPPERSGPPNFAALPPGTPPEQIFTTHRVYSMNVNMPNLNSATGSWIIHFAELRLADTAHLSGDLSAPVPLRKIDPKYPQSAMLEHIQGEVVLYGVIRQDGSVDSIQLVHGIDGQLDANAMAAFAQWKFQPATKGGQPVVLEAIVHIPFREPER